MSTIPPVIQTYGLDPNRQVEARIEEIVKALEGLATRAGNALNKVFGTQQTTGSTGAVKEAKELSGEFLNLDSILNRFASSADRALGQVETRLTQLISSVGVLNNALGQAENAKLPPRDGGGGKGKDSGTVSTGPVTTSLADSVNTDLSRIGRATGIEKVSNELKLFSKQVSSEFPEAAKLSDRAIKELSNDSGTLAERLTRLNTAQRELTQTVKAATVARQARSQQIEEKKFDLLTNPPEDADERKRQRQEIKELEAANKKLGIESRVAAAATRALDDQIKDLEANAKAAGFSIQKVGDQVSLLQKGKQAGELDAQIAKEEEANNRRITSEKALAEARTRGASILGKDSDAGLRLLEKRKIAEQNLADAKARFNESQAGTDAQRLAALNNLINRTDALRNAEEAYNNEKVRANKPKTQGAGISSVRDVEKDTAQAEISVTQARKLLSDATVKLAIAENELKIARRSGNKSEVAQADKALESAKNGLTQAIRAEAAAQEQLNKARDPKSTKQQVQTAQSQAAASNKQAAATNALTQSLQKQSEQTEKTNFKLLGNRDVLLGLLGVSRFLPGALGDIVSGLSLLSGAAETAAGATIGIVGALVAAAFQFVKLGADFNVELSDFIRRAQGFGIAVSELKALDTVLKETGQSSEDFSVLFGNVNKAIVGAGDGYKSAQNAIKLANIEFENRKPIEVFKDLIAVLADTKNQASGLSALIAKELGGRRFDEIVGASKNLLEQFDNIEQSIRKGAGATELAQKNAKEYQKSVAELSVLWDAFVAKIEAPRIATIILKFITDPSSVSVNDINKVLEKVTPGGQIALAIRSAQVGIEKSIFGNSIIEDNANKAQSSQGPKIAAPAIGDVTENQRKEADNLAEQYKNDKKSIDEIKLLDATKEDKIAQLEALLSRVNEERQTALNFAITSKSTLTTNLETLNRAKREGKSQEEILRAQDDVARSQKLYNDTLGQELDARKRSNKLKDDIVGLKKKDVTRHGRTDEQRAEADRFDIALEELRNTRRTLLPNSQQFLDNTKQEEADLKNRIAELQRRVKTGTDPGALGEIEKRTKELNRDNFENNVRSAKRRIEEVEELIEKERKASERLAALDTILNKLFLSQDEKIFERGELTLTQLVTSETTKLAGAARAASNILDVEIARLQFAIEIIKEEVKSGRLDQLFGAQRLDELQKKQDDLRTRKVIQNRTFEDETIPEKEKAAVAKLIEGRKATFEIQLEQQKSFNDRRIQLIENGSKITLDAERKFIEEEAKLRREEIQSQIDGLLNEYEAIRKTQVEIDAKTGKVTTTIPDLIKNASESDVDKVITKLSTNTDEKSQKLVEILKQLLVLKEQQADLEQNKILKNLDLEKRGNERKLELLNLAIDAELQLLDIQSRRVDLLKDSRLITESDAAERQLQIEKARLDILQQQLIAKRQEAAVIVQNAVLDRAASGSPVDNEFLGSLFKLPAVVQLQNDFNGLNGEMRNLSLSIKINDSLLGRFARGFGQLADSAEGLSERVPGLSFLFRGLQDLALAFLGKKLETPEDKIQSAAEFFKKTAGEEAGQVFKQAVIEASGILKGEKPKVPGIPGVDVTPEIKKGSGEFITKLFGIASKALQGASADSIGGKIAGFGGAATDVLGLFKGTAAAVPFVGAAVSIAAGVFEFVGSIFKKRAEKAAASIQTSIDKINQEFDNGSKTLGETIGALNAQLVSARSQLGSGKVSKKGGKAKLAEIEKSVQERIAELRKQAAETQAEFQQKLKDLRIPPELRSSAQTMREAFEEARKYIDSFEDPAEALGKLGDVKEFLERTFGELKEAAINDLTELLKAQADAERDFQRSRLAILNEGRVQTPFQQAQDRLARLFELEKSRAEEKANAAKEESVIRQRIAQAEAAFARSDKVIDRLADTLSTFTSSLNGILNAFSDTGLFNQAASDRALTAAQTAGISAGQAPSYTQQTSLQFVISNQTPERTANTVVDKFKKYGWINPGSGRLPDGRPFK